MNRLHTTEALQRICPDLKFWDYGAEFNVLWRMESLGTDHAIVVWADTPDDPVVSPVATQPYLTPFDWAIAACALNRSIRVTVVDLRPTDHDREDYAAPRWLRTLRPECVPWLRRLTVEDVVRHSNDAEIPSLQEIRALFSEPWGYAENKLKVSPRDALQKLPACCIDPNLSANHHAIANLVGPLLLIRNPVPGSGNSRANHREALRQILSAAGMAPTPKESAQEEDRAVSGSDMANAVAEHGRVRLLLIDDQWHHGWAEWVCECLGLGWDSKAYDARESAKAVPQCVAGNPDTGMSLWVSSTPHWVLDRTEKALAGKEGDARFALRLTDGDGEFAEILLLDLRLFPPGGNEAPFARRAAELARRFLARGAWPCFDEDELNGIRNGSRSTGDGFDHAAILTLLPRLLAHTDLSLPIVLFSSTRRRDIVESLRGYGSIFTQFSKPLLFGELGPEIAERAEEALQAALRCAQHFAKARKLCQRILHAAKQHKPINRHAPTQFHHIEIYLDESGSSALGTDPNVREPEKKCFVIGGLLVGYPYTEDRGPQTLHREMEEAGLRWWPEQTNRPYADHYLLKDPGSKKDLAKNLPGGKPLHRNETLGTFLKCLKGMKAYGYGICLEHDVIDNNISDDLCAEWWNDNRHRNLLSTLLELLLFDVIPTMVEDNPTISIFMATRVRKASEFQRGKHTIAELKELYGYRGSDDYAQVLSGESVLPIIFEVLARRCKALPDIRLKHARAVTLAYPEFRLVAPDDPDGSHAVLLNKKNEKLEPEINGQRPNWKNTRHQHYLADIVAGLCRNYRGNFLPNSNIATIFEKGVYDRRDNRLNSLLNVVRLLEVHDHSGALLELADCDFDLEVDERSAVALLLQRLAKVISKDLTGDELLSVAQEIGTEEPALERQRASRIERGTISQYVEGKSGFIRPEQGGDKLYFVHTKWRSEGEPSIGQAVEFVRASQDGRVWARWVRLPASPAS